MPLNQRILNFCLFLALVSLSTIKATEFRNTDVQNGLSNHRVFCSVRDSKGIIWFAKHIAIDKYDGETFTHYNFDNLNNNYKIKGVLSDRRGKIYAFTDKYLYCFLMGLKIISFTAIMSA